MSTDMFVFIFVLMWFIKKSKPVLGPRNAPIQLHNYNIHKKHHVVVYVWIVLVCNSTLKFYVMYMERCVA